MSRFISVAVSIVTRVCLSQLSLLDFSQRGLLHQNLIRLLNQQNNNVMQKVRQYELLSTTLVLWLNCVRLQTKKANINRIKKKKKMLRAFKSIQDYFSFQAPPVFPQSSNIRYLRYFWDYQLHILLKHPRPCWLMEDSSSHRSICFGWEDL